ncbi:DNA binding protein vP5 [Microviridae sp.]|nr:DNA binding protein vP5 [Microviridae sp.]
MRLFAIAVFDVAVDAFNRPFFSPSIGAAVRSFQDEVNRSESEMRKHPKDYDLYHVGVFDDQSGRFEPFERPEKIASGSNVFTQEG